MEIPCPYTGKVKKVMVKPGDAVKVGDELMTFDIGKEAEPAREEKPRAAEPIREERPVAGATPIEKPEKPKEEVPQVEARAERREEGPVPAAPSTRRLARELGVDLREVTPSGPGGRVTPEDVKAFKEGKGPKRKEEEREKKEEAREKPPGAARPMVTEQPELPDFQKWGPVERVPVRSIRRATARQMALAWSQIPHVNSMGDVDVTLLDGFIRKHKPEIEAKGGKLTMTVFALKAVAAALKENPRFNASLDMASGEMVIKHYYHVGVAVSAPEGLFVPVLRDVDRKSITEISVELKDLVERTRARKVSLDEMRGGTFTITNIGPMGEATSPPSSITRR